MHPVIFDPVAVAKKAHLRYVHDSMPGIRRTKRKHGYAYYTSEGVKITDEKELKRFALLGIPPAYQNVWISPIPNSHLQATGRDARNRKQYRYHQAWREIRSHINHMRMIQFGEALPQIRAAVYEDVTHPDQLYKTKILATVVSLLDMTLIRVGNQEYVKQNDSFGLTTMRDKHVTIKRDKIRFEFKGKSSKQHIIEVENKLLAKIVRRCKEIPGYELFQYYELSGSKHVIDSVDVNQYLQEKSQAEFTAKDFRTWWGTVFALMSLNKCEPCTVESDLKKNVTATIKEVSKKLGNTPAVCKKHYIYPGIIDAYLEGRLSTIIQSSKQRSQESMTEAEMCTLDFLKQSQSI